MRLLEILSDRSIGATALSDLLLRRLRIGLLSYSLTYLCSNNCYILLNVCSVVVTAVRQGGAVVRALDLRSTGHGFDFLPLRF